MRAPKISVDSAGAYLLPWAKQQLARFKRAINSGFKRFNLPGGETVELRWDAGDGFFDRIRIVANVVRGRLFRQQVAGVHLFAAYQMKLGKLDKYAIGGGANNPLPAWSWDASTYVYTSTADTPPHFKVSRNNAAPQTFQVISGLTDSVFNDFTMTAIDHGRIQAVTATQDGQLPGAKFMVSSDGTLLSVYGSRGYPDMYRLVAGSFILESSGEPAAITAFKATLLKQTYRYENASPSDDPNADLVYGPVTHFDNPAYSYYTIINANPVGFRVAPDYDHFNDYPLLIMRATVVDHVDIVTALPDSRIYHVYTKRVEVIFKYSLGVWTEIVRRAPSAPSAYFKWEETIGGGFNGLPNIVGTLGGLDIRSSSTTPLRMDTAADRCLAVAVVERGQQPRLAWINTGQTRTGQSTPPTNNGTLVNDQTPHLVVNGADQLETMAAFSTTETLRPVISRWSTGAVTYFDQGTEKYFHRASALTTSPLNISGIAMPLSPDGSCAWQNDNSGVYKFYCNGVLLRTYATSPPAASATYASPPADGFWFVSVLKYWSLDKATANQFKADLYTHTTFNGASWSWVIETMTIKYDPVADVFNVGTRYTNAVTVNENPADPLSATFSLTDAALIQDEFIPHK